MVRSHEGGTRPAQWHALAEEMATSVGISGVDELAGAPMEGPSRRHATASQMSLIVTPPSW